MQLNEILDSGAIRLPWPTLVNGIKIESCDIEESETCIQKCKDAPICASEISIGEHTCRFGITYFTYVLNDNTLTIFGVRGQNNKIKPNSYTKAALKGRSVTQDVIGKWILSIKKLIDLIERDFLTRQAEMLDPLHDPIRIAKQISTISNRLIQEHSTGRTQEEKINNASPELKTLVKAADFLSDSFELLTIYFNPAAATFSEKTSISLHGLLTKLVAIFRIDDGGITKGGANIFISGSCFRNVFVYESFKLIPFALLSNAVKYSLSGNIQASIEDRRSFIEVAVESTGPYIEDDEKTKIFEKRGRGRWASSYIEGRGVGLYLASIIAKAHNIQLKVTSRRTGGNFEGIPLAVNRFYFEITP